MVRVTSVLSRIPVIKFRKGGAGASKAPAASSALKPGSCPAFKAQAQPAAAMSTSQSIPDIDLPARYRRTPLSEEEIAHINGGGIREPTPTHIKEKQPQVQTLGVLRIPRGILIESGKKTKEAVTLNITLQKAVPTKSSQK